MTAQSLRRIAFYAPMKPPTHPAPSGDREMARLLMAALRQAGHEVTLVSDLRVFLRGPDDAEAHAAFHVTAETERHRIAADWARDGAPDLWACYHPYYKSPDLLGPKLCRAHGVPWVTFEASQSARRSVGAWADFQALALDAVRAAAANFAFTERDVEGLHEIDPTIEVERIRPFIDLSTFPLRPHNPEEGHLVAVAMMREGAKLDSFRYLASALHGLGGMPFKLTIVGDGPARSEVSKLFTGLAGKISMVGQMDRAGVAEVLSRAAAFVWPGCAEAFGVAYLEAQAAGVPVVAMRTAGVPEVVADGESGLLTDGPEQLAEAIARLLADQDLCLRLGAAGARRVRKWHNLTSAAERIEEVLRARVWPTAG